LKEHNPPWRILRLFDFAGFGEFIEEIWLQITYYGSDLYSPETFDFIYSTFPHGKAK